MWSYEAVAGVPDLVLDRVQGDGFERPLTWGMAHRNEAGTGCWGVPAVPRPRTQATPATSDAETGHQHAPYCQRSDGRIERHGLFVPSWLWEFKPEEGLAH